MSDEEYAARTQHLKSGMTVEEFLLFKGVNPSDAEE
jgi:hypothetical protein